MARNEIDVEDPHVDSKSHHFENGGMSGLTQVPTSVTLSAEQFERLYLNPMMHRQSSLTKNLGNPTPLYASFAESSSCFKTLILTKISEDWELLF
jgi:hypothetical protein